MKMPRAARRVVRRVFDGAYGGPPTDPREAGFTADMSHRDPVLLHVDDPEHHGHWNLRGPAEPRLNTVSPCLVHGEEDVRVAADHQRRPLGPSQPSHVGADLHAAHRDVDEQELEQHADLAAQVDRDGVRHVRCARVYVPSHGRHRRVLPQVGQHVQVPEVACVEDVTGRRFDDPPVEGCVWPTVRVRDDHEPQPGRRYRDRFVGVNECRTPSGLRALRGRRRVRSVRGSRRAGAPFIANAGRG